MSVEHPVKKFTIERATWARGGINGEPMLLNKYTGNKCCLGFYAEACGYEPETIASRGEPSIVAHELLYSLFPHWLVERNEYAANEFEENTTVHFEGTRAESKLININDNAGINDAEREAGIALIFAEHGVEVEFV